MCRYMHAFIMHVMYSGTYVHNYYVYNYMYMQRKVSHNHAESLYFACMGHASRVHIRCTCVYTCNHVHVIIVINPSLLCCSQTGV